ncbi:MAG: hypothetical protein LUJ09_06135 [Firmicutes bacterium]|nr:hypothetical protein [Bacillota bacterium]
MKTSKDMLSSLLKTTQMGQVGIRSVRGAATGAQMKQALDSQLREYNAIEKEAYAIAARRGWKLKELPAGARSMANLMAHGSLGISPNDSRIAGMMIQGNTRGVIKSLKNLHRYSQNDGSVSVLSQKLLDCENNNIRQMENFL